MAEQYILWHGDDVKIVPGIPNGMPDSVPVDQRVEGPIRQRCGHSGWIMGSIVDYIRRNIFDTTAIGFVSRTRRDMRAALNPPSHAGVGNRGWMLTSKAQR